MSVNIEATAPSMLKSLDSLKTTPLIMHRIFFEISSVDTWYAVMREARAWFGKEWSSQGHVKRKLERSKYMPKSEPLTVWFEVPDPKFGTWISVKLAVRVVEPPNK